MRFTRVVFPAPLGPMTPRKSPRLSWKSTLQTAITPPNDLLRFSTESSISAAILLHLDHGFGLLILAFQETEDAPGQSQDAKYEDDTVNGYPKSAHSPEAL